MFNQITRRHPINHIFQTLTQSFPEVQVQRCKMTLHEHLLCNYTLLEPNTLNTIKEKGTGKIRSHTAQNFSPNFFKTQD